MRIRRELHEAAATLSAADKAMKETIARIGLPDFARGRRSQDHFAHLVRAICGQQLSGAAAATIHGRVVSALGGTVSPEVTVATSVEKLRAAGLSMAKVRAVQDLAERVLSGELELNRVARMPDDEVISTLTQVRGIGPWTAEMFLMFQLGRLNVWPTTDLGVRKGYALIHGLALPPESKELELLGDDYRPFRSVAAWYCWRALDDR